MKQRLEWLDALRGFTMLMVVTNHVYGFGFATNTKYSMFMSLCLLFRMPLFFFISGFLAYKASFSWNLRDTGQLITHRPVGIHRRSVHRRGSRSRRLQVP